MSAFLAKVQLGALRPIDEHGQQALRKMQGKVVKVDARVPRNVRHHRLFWALATCVHETLPENQQVRYPDPESLVAALKIITGHRSLIVFPDGSQGYIPKSISFAKMDQTEFDAFFERCCDWICEHILPGVSKADLKREIEEMVGVRK